MRGPIIVLFLSVWASTSVLEFRWASVLEFRCASWVGSGFGQSDCLSSAPSSCVLPVGLAKSPRSPLPVVVVLNHGMGVIVMGCIHFAKGPAPCWMQARDDLPNVQPALLHLNDVFEPSGWISVLRSTLNG